jgi:SAM-dependent methyltransferase
MSIRSNPMRLLYRRLLHAVDNHGLRGIFPQPAPNFNDSPEPHPFDLAHGTDTSGHIPGEVLTPANLHNTAYYAISPSALTAALKLLPEPTNGFTFLDIGCGKGRALLVAAQFDFPKILGIEISPALCRTAESNTQSNPRIEIRQQDAAILTFPAAPLVVFLYHPFLPPVLRRVLANLERHHRANPHPTYLLYANCTYPRVLARFPFLQQIWDYSIPLSAEDAAADRHRITHDRFTLYRAD